MIKSNNRRETIIKLLDSSKNDRTAKYSLADNLFNLGLSMYSSTFSLDSIISNSFNVSEVDNSISFHSEQLKVLSIIKNNPACIISAPTSFGKTFCIFEYVAREKPKLVVLVVPTLALAKEYLMIFVKKYRPIFSSYKVHINIDEEIEYNFEENNVFILTHERAVTNNNASILPTIDLLVIDEVYKLDISENDQRSLIFNIAYSKLAEKSNKYVLLAPFVGGVSNVAELNKKPVFFKSSFSPVLNEVKTEIIDKDTADCRFEKCHSLYTEKCLGVKTMLYFPGPSEVEKYIRQYIAPLANVKAMGDESEFLKWAEEEFGEEWSICIALKKGFVVNHGKIPSGVRDYLLSLFNEKMSKRDCVLCTSTLLEGVNTATKNLIITKPSRISMSKRSSKPFKAFDFYNLIGRTGRLNQYYIGNAFYIKSDSDSEYKREDAEVTITFEVTEKTKDMDIQLNSSCDNQEVIDELASCGLTLDDFVNKIGTPVRFSTFKTLKDNFNKNKDQLIKDSKKKNTMDFYQTMNNSIVAFRGDPKLYGIIKKIVESRHRKTKDVLGEIKEFDSIKRMSVDERISMILNIKNNYLEHTFLNRCKVIKLICDKDNSLKELSTRINDVFIKPIEEMYYINSTYKKMLKNIGVYDPDIDKICGVIGTDYKNINELKERLIKYKNEYFSFISFISKYSINSIM